MTLSRTHQAAAMAVIIAAYITFRFWDLTASCLWFDEIFSIHAAGHDGNSMFSFIALDLIHPPLFYVLLKIWIAVGGESLLWLRSFPVVFSVLAVFPFLMQCRELKLRFETQALALFFFAVNGSLIKYSQEVRMYSLLLCLSLFSIWLFVRYFNKGSGIAALVLVNVLLVYTHYYGWFVVGSEAISILILQRAKWRPIAAMLAITLAAFIPWVVAVVQAAGSGSGLAQNIGWMRRPGVGEIAQLKLALVEPFYYVASSVDPLSAYRISIPLMIMLTAAIVVYIAGWKHRNGDEQRSMYILVLFAAFPMLAAFAASWIMPHSIWGTRHLIIVFAPVLILSAVAITGLPRASVRIAAITLLVLFSGYGFALQALREPSSYIWCSWEKLAKDLILTPHYSSEPKRLYVFEDLVAYHFWYVLRDLKNYEVTVVSGIEGITEDPAYFLPRGFDSVRRTDVSEISGDRFWIAFRAPSVPDVPGINSIGSGLGIPAAELGRRGFEPEQVLKVDAGGQTAYLVLMLRDPRASGQQNE